MKLDSLQKVFAEQLKDIYSAETQLLDALPKMHDTATNAKLKAAFASHLEETKGQVERLEKIFATTDFKPHGHRCKAMAGLIEEGEDIINQDGEPEAKDAALIGAAQKIEHYEIATYGTLCAYARVLNNDKACKLIRETLAEEKEADSTLSMLAEDAINNLANLAATH